MPAVLCRDIRWKRLEVVERIIELLKK